MLLLSSYSLSHHQIAYRCYYSFLALSFIIHLRLWYNWNNNNNYPRTPLADGFLVVSTSYSLTTKVYRQIYPIIPTRIMAFESESVSSATTAPADVATHHPDSNHGSERPSTTAEQLTVSRNIEMTLDPCVVLMKEMMGKYSDLWTDRDGIYSLAQGVVYWSPPDAVTNTLIETLQQTDNTLHLYGPDEGLYELRQVLRQKIQIENGLSNHNVMITMGANQAYMNCVLTLLDAKQQQLVDGGEELNYAVVFAPYYFNHVMALQMTISPQNILIGPIDMDTGVPDLVWLHQQFDESTKEGKRIRMVTLVNPGNPTGIALTKEQVQPLVDLCREYDCWLILDATYEYFVHSTNINGGGRNVVESTGNSTDSSTTTTHGGTDDASNNGFTACFGSEQHCIHIFSLSKAYALAGYRCGYIAIPNALQQQQQQQQQPNVFANMLKVQDTIPITPSRIGQVAALAAIRHAGPSWVAEQVATLQIGRSAILNVLETHLDRTIGGSGAMYVMGQLPSQFRNEDELVAETLVREYGVAVIPGSYCGFPGWIRVCYANLPPDRCILAAERLQRGLSEICKSEK